ncbi:hypothetical protein B2J93_6042 [Marssonina coronariae]|uniref:Amine oxidase domain-containing protein n=1 Tax=Diplocarpon coronariae TaxID=2795749 RepID=A0A218YZY5_9HELO|nr:hypothetical protein B2J93_6042 [Marssonina coronariae]
MESPRPHVCVVGAGVSGLRCAEVLLQNGFKVTILEARDRIGGRICQSDKLGYRVDLGPNWIHTSDAEGRFPILDLARKTKTPLHSWNDKQNIYSSDGTLLPAGTTDRLSSILWESIGSAISYSAEFGKDIPETASLRDYLKDKAAEKLPGQEEDQELLMKMAEMWGAYIGDPLERQSLKFAWMEECCSGDGETFVETTWEAILDEMAKLPRTLASMRLGQKVVGVQTAERDVEGSQAIVSTESGEKLEFDEVLMTTPLGWLKRNKEVFQPLLPERLLTGIDGVSVGHLEKVHPALFPHILSLYLTEPQVYITFPSAFWIDVPPQNADPTLSPASLAKINDTFPGYTNWLSPSYATSTNPQRFPIECWNLASFTPPNAHPTLIFYLYGPCSAYITNLVHGASPAEHHALLSSFFLPYISLLPNYTGSNPECEIRAILSTEWQKDELSGYGSYANFQVGVSDASGDVEAMRRGVPERRLWFAGEHCAPFEECGTVAGAYLSGEGVALRMLEVYGIETKI